MAAAYRNCNYSVLRNVSLWKTVCNYYDLTYLQTMLIHQSLLTLKYKIVVFLNLNLDGFFGEVLDY